MKTILDCRGETCFLSEEVYEVATEHKHFGPEYKPGTRVRLVSGIDGSDVPGHHFAKGWATVSRVDSEVAEFVGFPIEHLRPVEEPVVSNERGIVFLLLSGEAKNDEWTDEHERDDSEGWDDV